MAAWCLNASRLLDTHLLLKTLGDLQSLMGDSFLASTPLLESDVEFNDVALSISCMVECLSERQTHRIAFSRLQACAREPDRRGCEALMNRGYRQEVLLETRRWCRPCTVGGM